MKGDDVHRGFDQGHGKTSEWVSRTDSRWKARRDCLVHHCTCCQYEWDGAPLSEEP